MRFLKLSFAALCFISLAGNNAFCKTVTEDQARTTGFNFIKGKLRNSFLTSTGDLSLAYTSKSTNGENNFYVFNAGTGFVMVSAEDAVKPVLAFSDEAQFVPEKMSPSAQYMLNGYKSQIEAVKAAKMEASAAVLENWNKLNGTSTQHSTERTTSVVIHPLLGSLIWDQSPYYNDSCPNDPTGGGRSVTGCVATATAQVMRFWKWPASGVGSHSYTSYTRHFACAASFAHTYNWSGMPVAIAGHNSSIAQLMWDVGVAVDMDYSATGSGAYVISASTSTPPYCAQYALTHFFRYDATVIKGLARAAYSDDDWLTLIKNDLTAGLPVIYSGFGSDGGHCWVLDGYDDTLGTNYFHANWGWSGSGPNGYSSVDNMNPPALGTGGGAGGFINDQAAIFGVKPYMTTTNGTMTVCAGSTTTLTNATPGGVWISGSTATATVDSFGNITGVAAGTDTITYKIGTVKTTSVITVTVPPVAATVTGQDYVCINRTPVTLATSITGGTWSATNSNAQVLAGVVSGMTAGNDTVLYTLSNLCGSATDSFVMNVPSMWRCDSITGVKQVVNAGKIKVWPNPTTGAFVIDVPENVQNARIVVSDVYGKVYMDRQETSVNGQVQISIANAPDGVYAVRVLADDSSYNTLVTFCRH